MIAVALSERKKQSYDLNRNYIQETKIKDKKISKQLHKIFNKLNNSAYYKYYTDTDSKSFQNVLDFFTLLEKKCRSEYGKKSKYKKSEVEFVIRDEFPKLSDRGCQTIVELNKLLKKRKKLEFADFKFNGIIKGKTFASTFGEGVSFAADLGTNDYIDSEYFDD